MVDYQIRYSTSMTSMDFFFIFYNGLLVKSIEECATLALIQHVNGKVTGKIHM